MLFCIKYAFLIEKDEYSRKFESLQNRVLGFGGFGDLGDLRDIRVHGFDKFEGLN